MTIVLLDSAGLSITRAGRLRVDCSGQKSWICPASRFGCPKRAKAVVVGRVGMLSYFVEQAV